MRKIITLFLMVSVSLITCKFANAQSLLVSGGSGSGYTVNYPANTGASIPAGFMFTFRAHVVNVATCSLAVNGAPPAIIKKNGSFNLDAGDITAGSFVTVIYDGTNWQMLSVNSNPSSGSVWNTTGSDIYNNNAGNVGIGTTVPQAPLHIYKNAFAGILLDQDGTNTLSQVDFDMATMGTGTLPLANASTKGWRFSAYSNAHSNTSLQNDLRLNFYNGIIASPGLYFEAASGNVGIYTTSAINKLDVGGNMAIGGSYAANYLAPSNGLIVEGNTGIGTTAPGWVAGSQKYLSVSYGDSYSGASQSALEIVGSRNGTSQLIGKIDFVNFSTPVPTIVNPARIEVYTGGAAAGHGQIAFLTSNGTLTERMRLTEAGRLGIGVGVPTVAQLEVLGSINKTQGLFGGYNNQSVSLLSAPATLGFNYYQNNVGTDLSTTNQRGARIQMNGNNMVFGMGNGVPGAAGTTVTIVDRMTLTETGNLGLGVLAPNAKAHLDNGNATAVYQKFTAGTTTSQTATDGFDVGIDAAGIAEIRNRENTPIRFYTNGTQKMMINGDAGEVGIGTNSPLTKIDIRGTSASATTIGPENILQVAATDATNPLAVRVGVKTDATQTNRYGFIEALDAAPRNLILQPVNGNVGIGTLNVPINTRLSIRDGHLQSQQTTAPIAAAQTGLGTGASCVLSNATDVAGNFTMTGGTGAWAVGAQCRITFNKTYSVAPIVIINATNALAQTVFVSKATRINSQPGYFELIFDTAETVASRIFSYSYIIIETQ